eukprot:scaffold620_cov169-Amphora_coffeaeformis.AAC.8
MEEQTSLLEEFTLFDSITLTGTTILYCTCSRWESFWRIEKVLLVVGCPLFVVGRQGVVWVVGGGQTPQPSCEPMMRKSQRSVVS